MILTNYNSNPLRGDDKGLARDEATVAEELENGDYLAVRVRGRHKVVAPYYWLEA